MWGIIVAIVVGEGRFAEIIPKTNATQKITSLPPSLTYGPPTNVLPTDTVQPVPISTAQKTGELLLRWGEHGTGQGQFDNPGGLTVHNQVVYVGDEKNSRIQQFTLEGKFIDTWPVRDKNGQSVQKAGWPKFDSKGYLWIHEWPDPRLLKFDVAGQYLSEITVPSRELLPPGIDKQNNIYVLAMEGYGFKYDYGGNLLVEWGGAGQFGSPSDIAVDNEGSIFVAATWEHRIVTLSNDGKFIKEIIVPNDGLPSSIAVDSSGNIFVTDSASRRAIVFDKVGNLIASWDIPFGKRGQWIRGITLDDAGNVYIADWENDQILKFVGLQK